MATSCEKALDYYRRVATSVAEEVSFSGGQTMQRVRLQVGNVGILVLLIIFKSLVVGLLLDL